MQQFFGDAIVISGSLSEYPKIFMGYEIIFVVRHVVVSFLKAVLPFADDLKIEGLVKHPERLMNHIGKTGQ